MNTRNLPARRLLAVLVAGTCAAPCVHAQTDAVIGQVVISASRAEQTRFDAPAAIDVIAVDPLRASTPLVNLSELTGAVPGLQVRERQNYAQDLQVSVRGFGTRSTFGVRGVRILIDGIPATMPDGQGQAATASLSAASRIEVLRGPLAQLYGNAAGGVLQVFTRNPPRAGEAPTAMAALGAGSDGQRQASASFGAGNDRVGAVLDVSRYATDGYRDHSAAKRSQAVGKLVWRASADTSLSAIFNYFDQPEAQDPLGLNRADFAANPRQSVSGATFFNTRKSIRQEQAGLVAEHRLSATDTLSARLYGGSRQIMQTLSLSGVALTSSGGVVDLDRDYGGAGLSWSHKGRVNGMPLEFIVGAEADQLEERRQGFVNSGGVPGAQRRDEIDEARNRDLFAQLDWTFAPAWRLTAGARASRVRLVVDDNFVTAASPDDSGSVEFRKTSPVIGLVWRASDALNLYANLGRGFETPTLAESAYRAGGTGPNLSLRASTSVQAELGVKIKRGAQSIDLALFNARSRDEIVPSSVVNGRSIFQNVDGVTRRGAEAAWHAPFGAWSTRLGYTWLDASFDQAFKNAANARIGAGNRLPGAPEHSLFGQLEYQRGDAFNAALEMRAESKVYVNDVNSDAAAGYAVLNARAGYGFKVAGSRVQLYARLDNLLDKQYAGSLIVNDGNSRFYEAAPGRRVFVGLRGAL